MPGLRALPVALIAVVALRSGVEAQTAAASQNNRAQVLAASFSKSKHVAKEKRGVRKEKYLEVRSVPSARANPATYSGSYEVPDLGFSLRLTVAPNGSVEGSGHEPVDIEAGVMRSFTLRDGRIEGALLTANKVFSDGSRERFEGVFIDRTTRTSATDPGSTVFGLGVMGKLIQAPGYTTNKFFFQLKEQGASR